MGPSDQWVPALLLAPLLLFLLDIVAEQEIHVAQIQPAAGHNREHSARFSAGWARRIERPLELKAGRARLDQCYPARHGAEIQPAVGVGQGTLPELGISQA